MKIFILEKGLNSDIYKLLKEKGYVIESKIQSLLECNVVIVCRVKNNKQALVIIEMALQNGIEVICIKPNACKEDFTCNLLIREGAKFI